MRPALAALMFLTACSGAADDPGNPLSWPGRLFAGDFTDPAAQQRRGAVEVAVKSNHPAIMAEIAAGGGRLLTQAMEAARVPQPDRAARAIQLRADQGLYQANPGALVTALMLYGS